MEPADLMGARPEHVEVWLAAAGALTPEQMFTLVTTEDPEAEDAPELARWKISSLNEAEWAARKLRALMAQRDEVAKNAAQWIAEIEAWRTAELKRTDSDAAFFDAHLQRFALDRRAATGLMTLDLPSGKVRTTEVKAKLALDKEATDVLVAWILTKFDPDLFEENPDAAAAIAETRDEMLKVKKELLISGIRKHVDLGEMPTGRYVVTAGCGCELTLPDFLPDERSVECPEHGTGAVVEVNQEVRLVAEFKGDPVPGLVVEPKKVTATVTVI